MEILHKNLPQAFASLDDLLVALTSLTPFSPKQPLPLPPIHTNWTPAAITDLQTQAVLFWYCAWATMDHLLDSDFYVHCHHDPDAMDDDPTIMHLDHDTIW